MDKMNQSAKIARHLDRYGSITAVEAMQEYGIMRLASRISDLRKRGMRIDRDMVRGQNRFGEKTSYARYFIPRNENAAG